jgi:hypothetical protein
MKPDCEKIKAAFPGKAWVYAEQLDCIKIGKWLGSSESGFTFCEPLLEKYLLELRVFDGRRELKFTRDTLAPDVPSAYGYKCRDTADYDEGGFIPAEDAMYYMYGHGEPAEPLEEYTKLWEKRGGVLFFPAKLETPNGKAALILGVKNFVRYNPVPVLPKGEEYDFGLGTSGAGALEIVDYAYTGFFYTDKKAVAL